MATPLPPQPPQPFGLEELPAELRDMIYEDVAEDDNSAVIASTAITFLKGSHCAERKRTRTDFAVHSTSILFKSSKTRASYLRVLQKKLIKDEPLVRAFVIDCDFTNILKYIKAIGATHNQSFASFDRRLGGRHFFIHHSSTPRLPAQPPQLALFGKKMQQILKSGTQPKITHSADTSISASLAVTAFLDSNAHLEVENGETDDCQLGRVFYAYKLGAIMSATDTIRAAAPNGRFEDMAFAPRSRGARVVTERMRGFGMHEGSARLGWIRQDGEWYDDEDDEDAKADRMLRHALGDFTDDSDDSD